MGASVTFTFTVGEDIDPGQVNQNFTDLVNFLNGLSIPTTPVSIVNGGTGASNAADAITNLGGAPLDSPNFTGTPTAPNPGPLVEDDTIATCHFVRAIVPSGVVMAYGGNSAPTTWVICNGQSLTVAGQPDLFAVIGYTYGGSGANFNVPDLRGRVIAGVDNSAGRLTNATAQGCGSFLGNSGGEQAHTQTIAEMPVHTHTNNAAKFPFKSGTTVPGGSGFDLDTATVDNTGSGNQFNVVQPTLVMNWIMKL